MNTTVVSVSNTIPDWRLLQTLTHACLNRSITKSLDNRNILDRKLPAYIAILAEFQTQGTDYMSVLLDPGPLLKHISVSLLVRSDRETFFELSLDGELTFLDCEEPTLMLVSATLWKWREAIIAYMSKKSTERQREFAQVALLEFDKLGLGRLWERYSRQGNFLVEKK